MLGDKTVWTMSRTYITVTEINSIEGLRAGLTCQEMRINELGEN